MSRKPANKINWKQYSKELFYTISRKKSGIVLDARDFIDKKKRTKKAAFEFGSGCFQSKTVTSWRLFYQQPVFNECMEMFALKAKEIYASSPFSVLLTCTETSKYIMERTHSVLDTGAEMELRYLGTFPNLGPEDRYHFNLQGNLTFLAFVRALISFFL
jgi:hypothetical protein